MNLQNLQKTIKYEFKNSDLLKEALTHRSYRNENRQWQIPHNERLEFLGDAVLELVITEELFHRFPEKPEGELTPIRASLVNYLSLSVVAKEIDLDQHILLSRGEAKDNGRARDVILANAMEALIGAIYLDKNFAAAKKFINAFITTHLDQILQSGDYRDAKSRLQEKYQSEKKITPTYKVLEESGPEHQKHFKVGAYLDKELIATGEGYSKHEAELEAAANALSQ